MDTIYGCSRCNFEHTSIVVYQRHMEILHNIIPNYTCKLCNEKYRGNDEFDKHLEFTHGTNHWSLNLASKQVNRIISKGSRN